MHIGLTYDLKQDYLDMGWGPEEAAEFDSIETIGAIHAAIERLGHRVSRIGNCRALMKALVSGERWDMVFNIAEGAHGRGREAQVPAVLECFSIPYTMCDPLTAALTLDKAMAKRVVRDNGLATPDFSVVEKTSDIDRIRLGFPLFVKPLAEGTGKGISSRSLVMNPVELKAAAMAIIEQHQQPALVETYLPGREVTAGILGTGETARAIGVMEIIFKPQIESAIYSRHAKDNYRDLVEYKLVEEAWLAQEARKLAVSAYNALGCRDVGRVDLKADGRGKWQFLEVNPLPGLHPVDSDLPILARLNGIEYSELIEKIISYTIERTSNKPVCG
ncbi:MAG: D-alanine--D-alanine ligase [Desulfobacteraceae bacterium]|nr:D-alanine--D-alanine ligase [Desulfobacteraceae bacterium]